MEQSSFFVSEGRLLPNRGIPDGIEDAGGASHLVTEISNVAFDGSPGRRGALTPAGVERMLVVPNHRGHHGLMDALSLIVPEPRLRQGSVVLRIFTDEDAKAVAEACRDSSIPQFTFMAEGLTEEEARRWIRASLQRWVEGHARFAIVDSDSGDLLGQIGMSVFWDHKSAEAYYWLARGARGRGIASTALGMVADWAFDVVGIGRVFLLIHPDNQASHLVAQRCGFTREGVLRAYEPFKGVRPDVVSWSLLPNDNRPWRTRLGQFQERNSGP